MNWLAVAASGRRSEPATSRSRTDAAGYPYRLTGVVGHGERRGRLLGFPTANLEVPEGRLLPGHGHVCQAHLGTATYNAITNVGTRRVHDNPPNVEANLLDFSGNIYGARCGRISWSDCVRSLRFPSAEALIQQMHLDEAAARASVRERVHQSSE